MRKYAKFLMKRVLCRKSNMYMLIASIAIIFVFLIMNMRSQDEFVDMLEGQIQLDQQTIQEYQGKLANESEDSEAYSLYKGTIEFAISNMKKYENILVHFNNEDWSKVYEEYIEVLKENRDIIENGFRIGNDDDSTRKDRINFLDKEIVYIEYLKANDLAYQNLDFPVYGLNFTTHMSNLYLPIMITICCIYMLVQIFTMDYVKGLDSSLLLPIGKKRVFLTKVSVGIVVSIVVYSMILLVTFLMATLLTSNAGFTHPVLLQDNQTQTWIAMKSVSLFKAWFVIGILYYGSLSFFIYIVSLFIKEDGSLLFLMLCIVLGLALLPSFVDQVKPIAHLLPTTYMHYTDVATGFISSQYQNIHVNFMNGVQVLSISIVLQLAFCLVRNRSRVKG